MAERYNELMLFSVAEDFYRTMDKNEDYRDIRNMHPEDLTAISYDLAMFLQVFFEVPDRPIVKYQSTNIVSWHAHLKFEKKHGGQWLSCMQETLDQQPFDESIKQEMMERFKIATRDILAATT